MIYPAKVILNRIRILSDNQNTKILVYKGHLIDATANKDIDCNRDYGGELSALIDYLEKEDYLVKTDEHHVRLTAKGLHPYRQSWENTKHFLFTSIAVPIAVSVATSLIVLWLQGLFPPMPGC